MNREYIIKSFFDGEEIKDHNKEYVLIKRVSNSDTLLLYYESVLKDEEKEALKNKIIELDNIVENLMLTILDLIP